MPYFPVPADTKPDAPIQGFREVDPNIVPDEPISGGLKPTSAVSQTPVTGAPEEIPPSSPLLPVPPSQQEQQQFATIPKQPMGASGSFAPVPKGLGDTFTSEQWEQLSPQKQAQFTEPYGQLEMPMVSPVSIATDLLTGAAAAKLIGSKGAIPLMKSALRYAKFGTEIGLATEAVDTLTDNRLLTALTPLTIIALRAGLTTALAKGEDAALKAFRDSLRSAIKSRGLKATAGRPPIEKQAEDVSNALYMQVKKAGGFRKLAKLKSIRKVTKLLRGQSESTAKQALKRLSSQTKGITPAAPPAQPAPIPPQAPAEIAQAAITPPAITVKRAQQAEDAVLASREIATLEQAVLETSKAQQLAKEAIDRSKTVLRAKPSTTSFRQAKQRKADVSLRKEIDRLEKAVAKTGESQKLAQDAIERSKKLLAKEAAVVVAQPPVAAITPPPPITPPAQVTPPVGSVGAPAGKFTEVSPDIQPDVPAVIAPAAKPVEPEAAAQVEAIPAKPAIAKRVLGKVEPKKVISITEQPVKVPKAKVKPLIRDITGQVKVSDLVDERTALIAVMKAQRRAARGAFAEGRQLGVSIQKTHQQRVAEAGKLRQELRNRTASAIKTIKMLPTESLPLDYKKKLESMKADIDPARRTKATLAKRFRLKEFVDRQVAAGEKFNIPNKQLRLLDKKSIGEMTIEEVETLSNAMKQVAHVGRTKGKLLKIREGKQVQDTITELKTSMAQLKGRKTIPDGITITEITKKQFLAGKPLTAIRTYLQKNKRPERILEALDNYESNGANYKTIYQPVENAANESYANQQAKTEKIQQAIKANNIDLKKTVSEIREVNPRIKMTGEEMIEVYQSTFDADKLRHLKLGNRFTDKDIKDIIGTMTPQEKVYADWELNNYWRPQYAEINPHYEKLFNNSLPQVEGYSHITTDKDLSEYAPYEDDLAKELMGRQQIRAAFIERGFTKERVRGALQPLSLKHFDNLIRNIEKIEHFKGFAVRARDIRKILNHPEYKKDVTQLAGPETYKIINDWFGDVITRKPYTETSAAPSIKMLRKHSAVAMLGFNVLTSLKQFPSFFTAAGLSSSLTILDGLQQVIRSPKEIEAFVYARSPQLKNRSVERDIQEILNKANAAKVFAGKQTLSAKSMSLLRYVDKKVVLSIWKGVYDKASRPMPEPEAIKVADKVVRRSQPAWETKDLPAFFRGGETEKLLTMFMNQRNQNWNLFTHDVLGKLWHGKISKLEALRRFFWVWVMPALALGAITRGRLKRTGKEFAIDMIKFSPLAGTFLLGSLMDALISGWDWSLPAFQPFKELGTTFKTKKLGKKVKHGIKTTGLFLGIPTNQPFRTVEGAIDLLNGQTDDLRRLLYSEYALEEDKQKSGSRRTRRSLGRGRGGGR